MRFKSFKKGIYDITVHFSIGPVYKSSKTTLSWTKSLKNIEKLFMKWVKRTGGIKAKEVLITRIDIEFVGKAKKNDKTRSTR